MGSGELAGKLARYGSWAVLSTCGLVLALRAFWGPYSLGVRIDSPMNLEALLGLAIVLALLARSRPSEDGDFVSSPRVDGSAWPWILVLLLLLVSAFRHVTRIYFLSDDFNLLKDGHAPHALGLRTVFAADTAYGFYRPVARLSFALDSLWAGYHAAAWHASNLVLHFANSILVFIIASRLCASRFSAFFAAALFAVHGTRPEAAVWIAGRFDLLATFFVLCGFALIMRSVNGSAATGRRFRIASLACMVLAILSKESAYIFPLLLVLLPVLEGRASRRRFKGAIPFFLVASALFLHRLVLFGGIGGYRVGDSGEAQAWAFRIVPALKALVPRMWAVLFFPINWSATPGALTALFIVASVCALGWLAANRIDRRKFIFALGFTVVSALPPLHMLLISADLEKSRLLYLPSVGFCLMLAFAARELRGLAAWVAPGFILAFNLAALEHNLKAWAYASTKAQSACAAAVDCIGSSTGKVTNEGMPAVLRGVYFFGNGFQQCVELNRGETAPQAVIRPDAASGAEKSGRLLRWDSSSDSLRCVETR